MTDTEIAIIGAGIAGLTAAIAFAAKGAHVTVIEQAPKFEAVGAGLQLSPNASRILETLGLLPAIESRWREIDHVALVSGRNLRPIAEVPAGRMARNRWGAPYGVMLRRDLQEILLDAVSALPDCRIVTGTPIENRTLDGMKAEVSHVIGNRPALIVGADGVWSRLRRAIPDHGSARFSGNVAWRLLTDRDRVPDRLIEPSATTVFLGPSAHLVAYPLETGHRVNLVIVTRGRADADRNDQTDFARSLARWHPALRRLAKAGEEANPWPLYEVGGGPWHHGRDVVLIGDAAHAMMPFSAQGAAMAIEDAFELAELYSKAGDPALFASHRKARIDRVRSRTDFNRFAYHARGPIRLGRDLVLTLRSGESLAGDLDWLYGYQPAGTDRQ